jgi:HNH endonuclease
VSPIVRSGYAIRTRNGGTRAHRAARAQTLAGERLCCFCHEGDRAGDPWEAHHIIPYGLGGPDVRANYRNAHRSFNRRHGMGTTPPKE